MRYLQSYRFIFASPNWTMNVVWATLAALSTQVIPVVGQFVLIGYLFEVIDHFHYYHHRADAEGEANHYPDFNANRIMDYLMRGVWPGLASIVVMLPVALLAGALWFVGVIGTVLLSEKGGGGAAAGLIILLVVLFLIAIIFVGNVVAIPFYLRAGLSRDFVTAFSLSFARDFLSRVGWESVLAQLFMLITSTACMLLGMLACFVGIYPAMAIVFMASHYIDYELYELYLERGGTPVEIKQPMPPAGELA
jgi:hypothetical protein